MHLLTRSRIRNHFFLPLNYEYPTATFRITNHASQILNRKEEHALRPVNKTDHMQQRSNESGFKQTSAFTVTSTAHCIHCWCCKPSIARKCSMPRMQHNNQLCGSLSSASAMPPSDYRACSIVCITTACTIISHSAHCCCFKQAPPMQTSQIR